MLQSYSQLTELQVLVEIEELWLQQKVKHMFMNFRYGFWLGDQSAEPAGGGVP